MTEPKLPEGIEKAMRRRSQPLSGGDEMPELHDSACACARCEQATHERVTQDFERRREPRECSICRRAHGLEIIHASE